MTPADDEKAIVIGAGAWGTALACVCARAGLQTTLWCRSRDMAQDIARDRENRKYLKGHELPDGLNVTDDLSEAASARLVVLATPTQASRAMMAQLQRHTSPGTALIITAKGLERGTNSFLSEVARETVPQLVPFVLSGPSFASDVAAGLPTAVTLAGDDVAHASRIAGIMSTPWFRVYVSHDLIGAQIGGAVKNVLAIASGICAGKGLGASAQAALLARSFAELRRFAAVMGAKPETLFGLSGLGDLSLTCSSVQSRNFSLGVELGKGRSLQAILDERTAVSEGVPTAGVVRTIAQGRKIDMPVCEAVARIVADGSNVDDEIMRLMARPLKAEDE